MNAMSLWSHRDGLPFHSFVLSCFQENEMDLGLYDRGNGYSVLLRERRSDVRG